MSNIAGKAYAMNLITPVYVQTDRLLLLFIPGIFLILKSLSGLFGIQLSLDIFSLTGGWLLLTDLILIILGAIFLIIGLVNWLGIRIKIIVWLGVITPCILAIFCMTVAVLMPANMFSSILLGLGGLTFTIIGGILADKGVTWLNRFIFWLAGLKQFQKSAFDGLETLSLIHYARWVIIRDFEFPRLSPDQPKEDLKYGYMLFFSNFNGSWTQYVDSFSIAISGGLNLLWNKNAGWKDASVETPFNGYVLGNQIQTEHYYNAYPLASSNDIKSAQKVKAQVIELTQSLKGETSPDEFKKIFDKALLNLQHDLSQMEPTPIVSLAREAIDRRKNIQNA